MSEDGSKIVPPTDPIGSLLFSVTRALAVLGGVITALVAAMISVSVTGRYLFSAPIPGDYDIVGIAAGTAVFAFLPFCQLVRGNVVVDFFTSGAPERVKAVLNAFGSLLFLIVAVLITWRLYHGALDMRRDGEVLAAFPFYRWWTVPFDVVCMAMLILVVAYTFACDIGKIIAGVPDRTRPSQIE